MVRFLRKELLTITAIFVVAFTLGLTWGAVQNPLQFFGMAQSIEPVLYFLPSSGAVEINGKIPLRVILDTKGKTVSNINLILSFDPSLATVVSGPMPGSAFSTSSSKVPPVGSGIIQWSGKGQFTGSSYIFSVTLASLHKGDFQINFDHITVDGVPLKAEPANFQIN